MILPNKFFRPSALCRCWQKLRVRNYSLRDISETICIYNVLYATNRPFFQSIFFVFGRVVFLNERRFNGFKTWLCVFRYA